MQKFHLIGRISLAIAVVGLSACSDGQMPLSTETDSAPPVSTRSASVQLAGETAVHELARTVALALQDQGLRQRIKSDMRKSRHTVNHKLLFSEYLHGSSGGILLAKMAKESGKSRAELTDMLESLPTALEFYMPVDAHRTSWTGGDNLMVLGELYEDIEPVAYTLDGEEVQLSRDIPPATPVLALVPVETDFSTPLDSRYENKNDLNGRAIGTYSRISPVVSYNIDESCDTETALVECGSTGGGGTGSGDTNTLTGDPRGHGVREYITHFRTWNDHEPWYKDDAEFYLFVAGTRDTDSGDAELREEYLIPKEIWTNDSGWKEMPYDMRFVLWDANFGDQIRIECRERDWEGTATLTVSGTSTVQEIEVGFEAAFEIADNDDDCGDTYITGRLSTGEWGYIPDGNNPEYNGTTDLQWYGYGQQEFQ